MYSRMLENHVVLSPIPSFGRVWMYQPFTYFTEKACIPQPFPVDACERLRRYGASRL